MGNYSEAILNYTRVLDLDMSNVHALHNRGISYDKQGKVSLNNRAGKLRIYRPLSRSLPPSPLVLTKEMISPRPKSRPLSLSIYIFVIVVC